MGQEVAEADLFVGIGAIAWGFNLRKLQDTETGLEVPIPLMDYTKLLIAKPKWFPFDIAPRNEKRAMEIRQMFTEDFEKGLFQPAAVYKDGVIASD